MAKTILELFEGISCSIEGGNTAIGGIAIDSRTVRPGDLFFAYKGETHDGRAFIGEAISKKVAAVCTDTEADLPDTGETTFVRVEDVRRALAKAAARFWDHPSRELRLIGITGTNGKTTTAFFLKHIFSENGIVSGLIGTVRNEIGKTIIPAGLTTPEPNIINALLSRMKDSGAEAAVLEVSSQGIDRGRVDELMFSQAVFTNLSGEHLDYHGTMEEYFAAKRSLFERLPESCPSVVNTDDQYGKIIEKEFSDVHGVSMKGSAYLTGMPVSVSPEGTVLNITCGGMKAEVTMPRPGVHNCMNFLLAACSALVYGLDFSSVMNTVSTLPSVPGRFEPVECGQKFRVYVDYAHTDNALANVLKGLREIIQGRIITVFGAGGDRDRLKRPRMGKTACDLSDVVIITNDNPRTENPKRIISDIQKGTDGREWAVIPDRRKAIEAALEEACGDDAVLIAGKGHEDYQIIGTKKHHFSDKEVAQRYLSRKAVTQ